ncbi:hypothetical protein RIF29_21872 [Crotalaria pallida]|uniref:GRF-type domain-containing protein n=1 Tax=Crotalaria pallida TaxID=3830 RepID=A0AAN9IDV4_CROPI
MLTVWHLTWNLNPRSFWVTLLPLPFFPNYITRVHENKAQTPNNSKVLCINLFSIHFIIPKIHSLHKSLLFSVLAADSMASSSKSNMSSSRNESYGNSGYWPYCHCEEKAFIWTTRTNRNNNKGRRFWGCSHYQKDVAGSGCGYFEWYNQGSVDERDIMIMRQRMKLKTVERSLLSCKRQLKFTLIAACVFFYEHCVGWFKESVYPVEACPAMSIAVEALLILIELLCLVSVAAEVMLVLVWVDVAVGAGFGWEVGAGFGWAVGAGFGWVVGWVEDSGGGSALQLLLL